MGTIRRLLTALLRISAVCVYASSSPWFTERPFFSEPEGAFCVGAVYLGLGSGNGAFCCRVIYLNHKRPDDKSRSPQQPVKGGARCHVGRARLIHHEPRAVTAPNIQMRKSRFEGTSAKAKGSVDAEARWWGIGDPFNGGVQLEPCSQLRAPEFS